MITATIDTTGFTQGMAGLVQTTGATMKTIVEKETGELIKMLVKLSPPKSLAKTRQTIEHQMEQRFTIMPDAFKDAVPSSSGAVEWYFANDKYLYGIKEELDFRNAGGQEIAAKFATYHRGKTGSTRWHFPFQHPRKTQRVSINQNIVIAKANAAAAVKILVKKFGKLKASWLVAVRDGLINITGGAIPSWVTQQLKNAAGRAISELYVPNAPAFTIINNSPGISHANINRIVKFAIQARIISMKKNAELFTRGVKHLGDYAAGKATVFR